MKITTKHASSSYGLPVILDDSGRVMDYIDTPTQRVDAVAFEPATGALSDRRTLVHAL